MKKDEENHITMEDLCSFNLFDPKDGKTEKEQEDNFQLKARNFPNVAFSRFAHHFEDNSNKSFSISNDENENDSENLLSSSANYDELNTKDTDQNFKSSKRISENDAQVHIYILNSMGMFSTYSSFRPFLNSISPQMVGVDNFPNANQPHRYWPLNPQKFYLSYNQMFSPNNPFNQFQLSSFQNFPHQNMYSLPFNNSGPQMNSFNFTTNNNLNNFNFPINKKTQKEKTTKKESKKEAIVLDFNSLEELLEFLKGGKQIGNYIKCRTNTGTMINLIKKLPSAKIGELIEMIKHKLKDIMISNNKFCQKFFEQCTAEQRLIILNEIKDNFVEIAFNKWGSYSLQALIKIISLPEEQELIKECIKGRVYELSMDKQANFVLQKLILILNEKGMTPITEELFKIFNHLIYSPTGISLLKNLVLTNKSAETRKKFVQKVIENLPNLITNQNGHSLLLQMMEKWDFETCKPMLQEVFKDISKYALMRYSQQVVVKAISISEQKMIKSIGTNFFSSENISQLLKTECGNQIVKEVYNKLPRKSRMEICNLMESISGEKNEINNILSSFDNNEESKFLGFFQETNQ